MTTAPSSTTLQVRPAFRGDLEGMRAIAVLAVVLYHAGLPWLGGGFIGVDIFFTLSGFLITGVLLQRKKPDGAADLRQFYARRIRRLLPMAVLVLVLTTIVSAIVLPPLQARSVLTDARWTALYAFNLRLAGQGTDYLTATADPSPLQHYWSLGVEEQFYLLWPALLALVLWLARHGSSSPGDAGARRLVRWTLGAVAAGSFLLSLGWTYSAPPWAFFSLPTRAWQLAVGGLLALGPPALLRSRRVAVPLGWAGLVLIVAACHLVSAARTYPGTAALAPVLGCAAVIAAGQSGGRAGVDRLLAISPLRAVGRISYSWYLWHWPLFILAPAILGRPLTTTDRVLLVVLGAALATVSLVAVENPLRFSTRLRAPRMAFALAAVMTVAALVVTVGAAARLPRLGGSGEAATVTFAAVPSSAPAPPRPTVTSSESRRRTPSSSRATSTGPMRKQVQPPTSATMFSRRVVSSDPVPAAVRSEQNDAGTILSGALHASRVPVNLTPSLEHAHNDIAPPFYNGCLLSWIDTTPAACASADTSADRSVVLFGDSHAAQWYPALHSLANSRHWRLNTYTKTTCPPLEISVFSPYLGRHYTECEQWRAQVLDRIRANRPVLVVLGVARHYTELYHFTPYDRGWLTGLDLMVRELRATGAQVLVLGAIPKPPTDVPECLSANLESTGVCNVPRAGTVNAAGINAERAVATRAGASYLDLIPFMCGTDHCPVIVGNELIYRDDNHLTIGFAELLEPIIATEVAAVMAEH